MTSPTRTRMRRSRQGSSLGFLLVVIVLFAFLGVAIAAWIYASADESKEEDSIITHLVERGSFEHIVLEQGEVESSSNVEVICEVESRNSNGTAILWVIDEGTRVEAGDKLCELDSSALDQEIKEQRIVVNASQALKITSKSALEQATVALEEYQEGIFKEFESQIKSEIFEAEENLKRAEEIAKFTERLAAQGFESALKLKGDRFAVENHKVKLELARGKLNTLREITQRKQVIALTADIDTAQARYDAEIKTFEEENSKLEDLEEQIKMCVIRAPKAGQVVHANRYSSRGSAEFVVEAGSTVRERQTIIRLPDPTQMQVKATINEGRVTLVKVGMPVAIQIGAFEEDMLAGHVVKVNKYAEPSSWFSSQVKKYATWIQIADPPATIRTGMTAEVRIVVDEKEDVLQVPTQAIHEEKGHVFGLLKTAAGWETRELTLGASNDKTVIIESGLNPGETVVMNPRRHIDLMEFPELPDLPEKEVGKSENKLATANYDGTATNVAVEKQKKGEKRAGQSGAEE